MAQQGFVTATVLLLAAAAGCLALAAAAPAGWTAVSAADAEMRVPIAIAISHKVPAATLEATCQSVSDPDSSQYGKHLTAEGVAQLVADEARVARVVDWLSAVGAENIAVVLTRDWVSASLPAHAAVRAVGTPLAVWRHDDSGLHIVRAANGPARVPAEIADAADLIMGVWEFPVPKRSVLKSAEVNAAARVVPATSAPATPVVAGYFANETAGIIQFTQACTAAATATGVAAPCANDVDPIDHFSMQYTVNDGAAMTAAVPLADVTCNAVKGNMVSNCVAFPPVAFTPFTFVNMTLAAVSKSGAISGYGNLPWVNVTYDYRRMETSPYVTPQLLWNFYSLPDPRGVAVHPNVTQAVAEFSYQYYSPEDLAAFISKNNLGKLPNVTLVGPNTPASPGGEASLDIQWIMAVSPMVPTTFWSVAQLNNSDSFVLTWAYQMSNVSNPPLVTSISYGGGEDQFQNVSQGFGPQYISRTNAEFMKMCLRGLTVVLASGDGGSTNIGHGSDNNDCAIEPDFPSSSPWVTSVSASFITDKVQPRHGQVAGEIAVTIPNGMFWTTGGGFSGVETAPWYQQAAIDEYLNTAGAELPPLSSLWNKTGRVYPDVTAIGHNLLVQLRGKTVPIDGTSAAAPIFAGIISRLNAARLAAGKSPVGFLNPVLYKLYSMDPDAFYDLVDGNNSCGVFDCCPNGFPVTKGYDAVTGLGSVGDYRKLEQYVLSLQ